MVLRTLCAMGVHNLYVWVFQWYHREKNHDVPTTSREQMLHSKTKFLIITCRNHKMAGGDQEQHRGVATGWRNNSCFGDSQEFDRMPYLGLGTVDTCNRGVVDPGRVFFLQQYQTIYVCQRCLKVIVSKASIILSSHACHYEIYHCTDIQNQFETTKSSVNVTEHWIVHSFCIKIRNRKVYAFKL